MRAITTIGCEGASPERFDDVLSAARIDVLVDVRDAVAGRQKDFTADALAARMQATGRLYVRLRDLSEAESGYAAEVAGLARLAVDRRVALVGYEAEAEGSPRSQVAERVADLHNLAILHLRVAKTPEISKETWFGQCLAAA
jgi:hypothetical protein